MRRVISDPCAVNRHLWRRRGGSWHPTSGQAFVIPAVAERNGLSERQPLVGRGPEPKQHPAVLRIRIDRVRSW